MKARQQVEFAAEGEDSSAVVFEVAEAKGVGFDGLYIGSEAFGESVGDAVGDREGNPPSGHRLQSGPCTYVGSRKAARFATLPPILQRHRGRAADFAPILSPAAKGAAQRYEDLLLALAAAPVPHRPAAANLAPSSAPPNPIICPPNPAAQCACPNPDDRNCRPAPLTKRHSGPTPFSDRRASGSTVR